MNAPRAPYIKEYYLSYWGIVICNGNTACKQFTNLAKISNYHKTKETQILKLNS